MSTECLLFDKTLGSVLMSVDLGCKRTLTLTLPLALSRDIWRALALTGRIPRCLLMMSLRPPACFCVDFPYLPCSFSGPGHWWCAILRPAAQVIKSSFRPQIQIQWLSSTWWFLQRWVSSLCSLTCGWDLSCFPRNWLYLANINSLASKSGLLCHSEYETVSRTDFLPLNLSLVRTRAQTSALFS